MHLDEDGTGPTVTYLADGFAREQAERYVDAADLPVDTESSEILVRAERGVGTRRRPFLLFTPADNDLDTLRDNLATNPEVYQLADYGDITTYTHRIGEGTYDIAILKVDKVDVDINAVREILEDPEYSQGGGAQAD